MGALSKRKKVWRFALFILIAAVTWFLFFGVGRMMSDYKVEMVNDGMSEFYVEFHGPRESMWVHFLSLPLHACTMCVPLLSWTEMKFIGWSGRSCPLLNPTGRRSQFVLQEFPLWINQAWLIVCWKLTETDDLVVLLFLICRFRIGCKVDLVFQMVIVKSRTFVTVNQIVLIPFLRLPGSQCSVRSVCSKGKNYMQGGLGWNFICRPHNSICWCREVVWFPMHLSVSWWNTHCGPQQFTASICWSRTGSDSMWMQ